MVKFDKKILNYSKEKREFSDCFIEKDFYLSIILDKISDNDLLKEMLVFKGGTCLYRGYLEYYRGSEDLDFIINQNNLYKFEGFNQGASYYLGNGELAILLNDGYTILKNFNENKIDLEFNGKKYIMKKYSDLSDSSKKNLLHYLQDFILKKISDKDHFKSIEGSCSTRRNFFNLFFNYEQLENGSDGLKNGKVEIEVSIKEHFYETNKIKLFSNSMLRGYQIFNNININCLDIHEVLGEKLGALFGRGRVEKLEEKGIRVAIRDFFDVYMINLHSNELKQNFNFEGLNSKKVYDILFKKFEKDINNGFYFIDINGNLNLIKSEIKDQSVRLTDLLNGGKDYGFFENLDKTLQLLIKFQENIKTQLGINGKSLQDGLIEKFKK